MRGTEKDSTQQISLESVSFLLPLSKMGAFEQRSGGDPSARSWLKSLALAARGAWSAFLRVEEIAESMRGGAKKPETRKKKKKWLSSALGLQLSSSYKVFPRQVKLRHHLLQSQRMMCFSRGTPVSHFQENG